MAETQAQYLARMDLYRKRLESTNAEQTMSAAHEMLGLIERLGAIGELSAESRDWANAHLGLLKEKVAEYAQSRESYRAQVEALRKLTSEERDHLRLANRYEEVQKFAEGYVWNGRDTQGRGLWVKGMDCDWLGYNLRLAHRIADQQAAATATTA